MSDEATPPRVGDVITHDGPVPLREVLRMLSALLGEHDPNCRSHGSLTLALDAVLADPRVVKRRGRRATPGEARKGVRIPEDFVMTPDMRAWAAEKYPWVNPEEQTEHFVDFWRSKPGQGACKLDWGLTWKNWIRSAANRAPAWERNAFKQQRKPVAASSAIPPVDSWYDK